MNWNSRPAALSNNTQMVHKVSLIFFRVTQEITYFLEFTSFPRSYTTIHTLRTFSTSPSRKKAGANSFFSSFQKTPFPFNLSFPLLNY